ncbi:MAG TPA: fused MFS/spermidine synthase [Caldilineaceae bacterium]|nr:fused MFS/spermidine synthase [Caldilineaceae bacterium]
MRYLSLLVFTTGLVTLGMELSASRLIEPAFGNNQIVWSALIGLILLYLAVGAWLGGRLADRFPRRRELDYTITLAAVGVAFAPAFSRPVLALAAEGMASLTASLLAGALLAILLLFSVPGVLLGAVTPWAVRLAVNRMEETGRVAGRLSALNAAGSLAGAFLPALWLIPAFGTRWTFYLLALALLVVVSVGALAQPYRWAPLGALALVIGLALVTQPGGPPVFGPGAGGDDAGEVIYADESAYNTIVVRQWGEERHLRLNEGIGLHSVYHPQMLLSQGIWDYFLLAPLFRRPPAVPDSGPGADDSLLLIGLAAGTVSGLYTTIYGPLPITGIELDPQIIEVGRRYFEMDQPNLTAIAADGRRWLAQQPDEARWSIIAVDAYRPPYIPFHLTTVEFFRLAHAHLREDGVLAINVGRTPTNFSLVDALAATAMQVFPSVFLVDEPGPPGTLGNTLLVATAQPANLDQFAANVAALPERLPAEFRAFAAQAQAYSRVAAPPPDTPIFTDDHAPVERIVHSIILDFLRGN